MIESVHHLVLSAKSGEMSMRLYSLRVIEVRDHHIVVEDFWHDNEMDVCIEHSLIGKMLEEKTDDVCYFSMYFTDIGKEDYVRELLLDKAELAA